jgi:hypothetical protein
MVSRFLLFPSHPTSLSRLVPSRDRIEQSVCECVGHWSIPTGCVDGSIGELRWLLVLTKRGCVLRSNAAPECDCA